MVPQLVPQLVPQMCPKCAPIGGPIHFPSKNNGPYVFVVPQMGHISVHWGALGAPIGTVYSTIWGTMWAHFGTNWGTNWGTFGHNLGHALEHNSKPPPDLILDRLELDQFLIRANAFSGSGHRACVLTVSIGVVLIPSKFLFQRKFLTTSRAPLILAGLFS